MSPFRGRFSVRPQSTTNRTATGFIPALPSLLKPSDSGYAACPRWPDRSAIWRMSVEWNESKHERDSNHGSTGSACARQAGAFPAAPGDSHSLRRSASRVDSDRWRSVGCVYYTYMHDQRTAQEQRQLQALEELRTKAIEVRKAFNDKQLALYVETSQVVGRLVAANGETASWKTDFARFEQLYWAELSMVEDDGVKSAMQELYPLLKGVRDGKLPGTSQNAEFRNSAYRLARALRASLENTWNVNLSVTPVPTSRP